MNGHQRDLVVPRPVVDLAMHLGIPHERVIGAQPRDSFELSGASVHPVPARHGVDVSDACTFGERLSGDIVGAFRLHLALLPINGRDFYRETERNLVGNMDFREAARLAADLKVEAMLPMHWELLPHNRGFPGDLVAYVTQFHPQLTMLTLGRGGRLRFLSGD